MEELWCVTYQYHDKDEKYEVKSALIKAESIGMALSNVAEVLDSNMEKLDWSDYHVTSMNIIPEMH